MTQMLTSTDMSKSSRPREARWFARPEFALFLFVLAFTGPVIHHWGEQQASRYALTAALWDQRTVVIDDYAHLLGRDRAVIDGVTYSDKAPGQPFLAVPFYGMYRIMGGNPPTESYDPDGDIGQWWVTFWSAAVPGALLAVLMYRWAKEVEERTALIATLTIALGTLLVVYSTILFGHVLAALCAFAMFLLVRREDASWRRLIGAGALGGLAVLVEYPVVLLVVVIATAAFVRHRLRAFAILFAGLPTAVLLGVYQWRLFGDPFTYTYRWSAFSGPRERAGEFLGFFNLPSLERLLHVLFSPRGLVIATPIMVVALLGLVPMWRRGWRVDAAISFFCFLSMLAIPVLWGNSYAGGAGPRYLTPSLPFLAAPLALAWVRWRVLAIGAGAISVLTMISATLIEPQMATEFEAGLRYWLRLAFRADFEPLAYAEILGSASWVVYVGSILAVGVLLARVSTAKQESARQT